MHMCALLCPLRSFMPFKKGDIVSPMSAFRAGVPALFLLACAPAALAQVSGWTTIDDFQNVSTRPFAVLADGQGGLFVGGNWRPNPSTPIAAGLIRRGSEGGGPWSSLASLEQYSNVTLY